MSERYDDDFDALFGGADRGDLGFFQRCAAETRGPVCEVGAGTGRVLLSLVGVTGRRALHGVEPSEGMRARFEARRDALGARRVKVLDGSFTDLPLASGSQGLVYAAFRSFQHVLTVDDQLAGLAEMRRVMAPEGRFAIDLFDPHYGLLCDDGPRRGVRYRTGQGTMVERWESRRVERLTQQVEVTFRWVERTVGPPDPGRVVSDVTESYAIRYTFPQELLHLLARVGFRDVVLAGGYDGRPLGAMPRELVVTARKGRAPRGVTRSGIQK
jgi:ubiquinone/menaquinone biosynthesis C-methylase UbiE